MTKQIGQIMPLSLINRRFWLICFAKAINRTCLSPTIILLEGQSGDVSPTKKCCNHFDAFAQELSCADVLAFVANLCDICHKPL